MAAAVQSITNRTLSGLLWTFLATGAQAIALLLAIVILARLLTPADFGLAAAALMVMQFAATFAEFGIGPAVVQRRDLQTTHLRSGFTLSLLLGVLLGVLTWLTAPAVAGFFHLEELTPILRTLAVLFPVQSLAVVADSLLQRELRFRCLAVLDVVTLVLGYGVVGISMAFLGCAAWSLVGAHLTQMVLRTVLLLFLRPHPARPLLDAGACRELLYFGGGFTASRFSNCLAGQGEHVVIGRCLGAVALGVYGRAYHLMAAPAVLFGNVLDRVLFPAMVHVQDQPARLADAYRRGVALIALVILPVSAILVALAPEVVHLLLGPEWQAVTLPLQILGVGMLFRTGCKISDSLVRAAGAVYHRTWRQTIYAILVVAGALVGQRWGIEGVAGAVLVTLAVNFFLMAQLALRVACMSWRTFGIAHLSGIALAALVGVPVAVSAAVLRGGSLPSLLVLVASLAALLPALVVAGCLPGVFLGKDGQWMARKLRALLFGAREQPQPHQGTEPMRDALNATRLPAASAHANGNGSLPCRGGGPLRLLTRRLASAGVRYCRWKARLDLERVLTGKGDLDLLVDRKDAELFLRTAAGLGFTRVIPCFEPPRAQEMHLYGLDGETGALLHLHVNWSLLEDESVHRNLVPPLEALVLQHCSSEKVPGLLEGMPVVQARAEVIVFVLRAMEQYARLGKFPRLVAKRGILRDKLQALLSADAGEGYADLLERWLPSVPPSLFAECLRALQEPTSWLRRFRLARRLRRRLRSGMNLLGSDVTGWVASSRGNGEPIAPERAMFFRLAGLLRAGWWRLLHGRGNPKRLPLGGRVIAFIGPDACGKSTMVAETTRWLGQVFRVQAAHLGKPPSTWLTLLPNLTGRLLRVVAPHLRPSRQQAACSGAASGPQGLLYRLSAVLLAWDRRTLARRLSRKAARGWFIVCDRYPSVVVGAHDSARLKAPAEEAGQTGLRAFLARLENRLYLEIPSPDMVFRLSAPLAVAIDRNKEREKAGKESADYVRRRHKAFIEPHFVSARTFELDTNQPRAASLQLLRQRLWELLCRPESHGSCHPEDKPTAYARNGIEEGKGELQKR